MYRLTCAQQWSVFLYSKVCSKAFATTLILAQEQTGAVKAEYQYDKILEHALHEKGWLGSAMYPYQWYLLQFAAFEQPSSVLLLLVPAILWFFEAQPANKLMTQNILIYVHVTLNHTPNSFSTTLVHRNNPQPEWEAISHNTSCSFALVLWFNDFLLDVPRAVPQTVWNLATCVCYHSASKERHRRCWHLIANTLDMTQKNWFTFTCAFSLCKDICKRASWTVPIFCMGARIQFRHVYVYICTPHRRYCGRQALHAGSRLCCTRRSTHCNHILTCDIFCKDSLRFVCYIISMDNHYSCRKSTSIARKVTTITGSERVPVLNENVVAWTFSIFLLQSQNPRSKFQSLWDRNARDSNFCVCTNPKYSTYSTNQHNGSLVQLGTVLTCEVFDRMLTCFNQLRWIENC